MSSETMYRILVSTVFVLLLTISLYVGIELTSNDNVTVNADTDNIDVNNNEEEDPKVDVYTEEIGGDEDHINVVVKYVDIYSECGHSTQNMEQYYDVEMGSVKKDVVRKHEEYSLLEESGNILIFQRVHSKKCANHFLVKVEDDKLKVYRVSADTYELYQVTDIEPTLLREDMLAVLEKGIYANSLEELFMLLEDIES